MSTERRNQPSEDADDTLGVLGSAGAIDTADIGLLGETTAQVPVTLPETFDEDDLVDDDVTGGEAYADLVLDADPAALVPADDGIGRIHEGIDVADIVIEIPASAEDVVVAELVDDGADDGPVDQGEQPEPEPEHGETGDAGIAEHVGAHIDGDEAAEDDAPGDEGPETAEPVADGAASVDDDADAEDHEAGHREESGPWNDAIERVEGQHGEPVDHGAISETDAFAEPEPAGIEADATAEAEDFGSGPENHEREPERHEAESERHEAEPEIVRQADPEAVAEVPAVAGDIWQAAVSWDAQSVQPVRDVVRDRIGLAPAELAETASQAPLAHERAAPERVAPETSVAEPDPAFARSTRTPAPMPVLAVSTAPEEENMTADNARIPEPGLTSRRLDQLGDRERESADLLTADRLLDSSRLTAPEPEGLWSHLLYTVSGRRINLGDGKRAQQRKALSARIAAPLPGTARFVPVLSRKGGVGKTTVTALLGMALADAREDRVIAVDANPDRGTLADRIARTNSKTVRDLVRIHDQVTGYHDISAVVSRDATRLDVLASDTDPRISEAFSDVDYDQVASVAAHYYSLVLTDTGTGIVHSVMGATLDRADTLVIVAGLSVDEARLASETLTWLEANGHTDKVREAVVVLNQSTPGSPMVRLGELEAHFRTRVARVLRIPYDPQIAAGSAITFAGLQPETRQAARELAAIVVEGLRARAA